MSFTCSKKDDTTFVFEITSNALKCVAIFLVSGIVIIALWLTSTTDHVIFSNNFYHSIAMLQSSKAINSGYTKHNTTIISDYDKIHQDVVSTVNNNSNFICNCTNTRHLNWNKSNCNTTNYNNYSYSTSRPTNLNSETLSEPTHKMIDFGTISKDSTLLKHLTKIAMINRGDVYFSKTLTDLYNYVNINILNGSYGNMDDDNYKYFDSYRNINDKKQAILDFFNPNISSTLVLIHFRKAGGTTMKHFLRKILNEEFLSKYNNTIINFETYMWQKTHNNPPNPLYNFTDYVIKYPNYLYVTAVRDPVSRIISQCNMDWRNNYNLNTGDNNKYYKSETAKFNASINTMFNGKGRGYIDNHYNYMLSIYNREQYVSSNYNNYYNYYYDDDSNSSIMNMNANISISSRYTKLNFDNIFLNQPNNSIDIYKLWQSLKILNSFDIVLITEWFSDPIVVEYVNNILVQTDLQLNSKISSRDYSSYKFGYVNALDDEMIKLINNINIYDNILYQVSRQMLINATGQLKTKAATVWEKVSSWRS